MLVSQRFSKGKGMRKDTDAGPRKGGSHPLAPIKEIAGAPSPGENCKNRFELRSRIMMTQEFFASGCVIRTRSGDCTIRSSSPGAMLLSCGLYE